MIETVERTDNGWQLFTQLPNGLWVSTINRTLSPLVMALDAMLDVALGRDRGDFETMVFKNGSHDDLICVRYATEEEARAGHERIVAEWSMRACPSAEA